MDIVDRAHLSIEAHNVSTPNDNDQDPPVNKQINLPRISLLLSRGETAYERHPPATFLPRHKEEGEPSKWHPSLSNKTQVIQGL